MELANTIALALSKTGRALFVGALAAVAGFALAVVVVFA